jgi:gliding motility-associated lipoprotein GldH
MKSKLPLFIMLVILLTSCINSGQYHHSQSIPSNGWNIGNTLHFEDSISNDLTENLKFEVDLRHNTSYPYSNLWLYIRTSTSDGNVRMDTVNWVLANTSGHWLGTGWGSLYSLNYRLRDLTIRKGATKRWFKIDIRHGLRDDVIKGVENIGVKISAL